MRKLHIAVDFDEVIRLLAEPIIYWYNLKNSTDFHVDANSNYALEETWGKSSEEAVKEIDEYIQSEEHQKVSSIVGAKEVLTKLRAEGHELTIITARPTGTQQPTKLWIDQHLPGLFEGEIFTHREFLDSKPMSKEEILLREEMDVLIDDNPRHIPGAQNKGISAILFGNYVWNNQQHSSGNVKLKAKDWAHTYRLIQQLANE